MGVNAGYSVNIRGRVSVEPSIIINIIMIIIMDIDFFHSSWSLISNHF